MPVTSVDIRFVGEGKPFGVFYVPAMNDRRVRPFVTDSLPHLFCVFLQQAETVPFALSNELAERSMSFQQDVRCKTSNFFMQRLELGLFELCIQKSAMSVNCSLPLRIQRRVSVREIEVRIEQPYTFVFVFQILLHMTLLRARNKGSCFEANVIT